MKIDFEQVLAQYGLQVGDKVRFIEENKIFEIFYVESQNIYELHPMRQHYIRELSTLGAYEWEKVVAKKKVGDLICRDVECDDCPLQCVKFDCAVSGRIKENWEDILKTYPQLEPMRPYIESELNKEVE